MIKWKPSSLDSAWPNPKLKVKTKRLNPVDNPRCKMPQLTQVQNGTDFDS
jgi:hypothetical protein